MKISKFQTHKIRLVLQNVEPSCLSIVAVVDLKLRLRKLVIVFECRIHSICTIKPTYTLRGEVFFKKLVKSSYLLPVFLQTVVDSAS